MSDVTADRGTDRTRELVLPSGGTIEIRYWGWKENRKLIPRVSRIIADVFAAVEQAGPETTDEQAREIAQRQVDGMIERQADRLEEIVADSIVGGMETLEREVRGFDDFITVVAGVLEAQGLVAGVGKAVRLGLDLMSASQNARPAAA